MTRTDFGRLETILCSLNLVFRSKILDKSSTAVSKQNIAIFDIGVTGNEKFVFYS